MVSQKVELKMKYDATVDVLYCSLGEPRVAVSMETEEGVILRLDPETDELVGMTVVDFAKRFLNEPDKFLSFPLSAAFMASQAEN